MQEEQDGGHGGSHGWSNGRRPSTAVRNKRDRERSGQEDEGEQEPWHAELGEVFEIERVTVAEKFWIERIPAPPELKSARTRSGCWGVTRGSHSRAPDV